MKRLCLLLLLLACIPVTTFAQITNPPWILAGSNPTYGQYLSNTPTSIRDLSLWQKDRIHMGIIRVDRADATLSDYTFFLSPTSTNTYYFDYFGYSQGKNAAVHFQNLDGSGLVCYAPHRADWGQNIISVVTRPNTASYVMNYNGNDWVYTMGSGYVAARDGFWNFSDARLKTDIHTIKSPLTKVKALRGVTYKFIPEVLCDSCDADVVVLPQTYRTEMGLIAQEVEDVVPEIVRDEHNGYKAVAYANLVALLVEAIKEMDNKFVVMEKKVTELESRLNSCCDATHSFTSPDNHATSETGSASLSAAGYQLDQNIPNPSNGSTAINYVTPANDVNPQILIFDMQGKLMKTYTIPAGRSTLIIQKGELSAGMYFYSLIVNSKEIDTKRMILTD